MIYKRFANDISRKKATVRHTQRLRRRRSFIIIKLEFAFITEVLGIIGRTQRRCTNGARYFVYLPSEVSCWLVEERF